MAGPRSKLQQHEIDAFAGPAGWRCDGGALSKDIPFSAYRDGVAFAVAVAMLADQRDHHPDLGLGYGKVSVRWSTHDAGGITGLDLELARATDELAARHGAQG